MVVKVKKQKKSELEYCNQAIFLFLDNILQFTANIFVKYSESSLTFYHIVQHLGFDRY